MDTAVLSGALILPEYETRRRESRSTIRIIWTAMVAAATRCYRARWDWVDPLKDIRAEVEAMKAGLKSRSQAISERGYDASVVDSEIAADRKREQKLGIISGQKLTQ